MAAPPNVASWLGPPPYEQEGWEDPVDNIPGHQPSSSATPLSIITGVADDNGAARLWQTPTSVTKEIKRSTTERVPATPGSLRVHKHTRVTLLEVSYNAHKKKGVLLFSRTYREHGPQPSCRAARVRGDGVRLGLRQMGADMVMAAPPPPALFEHYAAVPLNQTDVQPVNVSRSTFTH